MIYSQYLQILKLRFSYFVNLISKFQPNCFEINKKFNNLQSLLVIVSIILIFTRMSQPNPSLILTEQQLKKRRRDKIIARSQIVAQQTIPSSLPDPSQKQPSRQENMTAYEMFKSSKKYESYKFYLEIVGIVLGLICAIVHVHVQLVEYSQTAFSTAFVFIAVSALFIEGKRLTKVSKFTTSSGIDNDPLLSKVTNMKHLGVVNKILAVQASISPITKFMSTFLLSILALNCVISK